MLVNGNKIKIYMEVSNLWYSKKKCVRKILQVSFRIKKKKITGS